MFLFGAVVGSFLNVCIYRLPKEESLIKSNSHCMKCGTPILKRDLIPIVSWCLLRGKCRACGDPISPRYTIVELLNAVGWVLIALKMDLVSGRMLYTILCCLVYSALIVVFFMDWDTQLISTGVCVFIAILAVPEMIFCSNRGGVPLKSHIIGLFAASVPLLLIFLISKGKAMGLGDVYLMAGAGFFLGTSRILVALLLGIVLGAVAGVILKRINGESAFAFGPWLSIGILTAMLWGFDIANWYMNFTGLAEIVYGEDAVMNLPFEPIFPY
ncbi:MAG: prepilin peptidase [Ruminococcus sp.]|nr:prepilin peptidase [Ruminococcus sp.]